MKLNLAGRMRVSGNALLRTAEIETEFDGVPTQLFGPVANPLEMIFRFARGATAPVYADAVTKGELAAAVDKELGHTSGFQRSAVAQKLE
jgi:hypothetical protein